MPTALFEAILAYATIPLYVMGLLILVYIIAHSQLGFSFSNQIKESVKTELMPKRPTTPVSSYLILLLLFLLFTFLTITTRRRLHA